MQNPKETLQLALNNMLNIDVAIGDIEKYIEVQGDSSLHLPALRALWSMRESKFLDFCGHLRQCMTYYTCSFNISQELYDIMFEYKNMFGFIFSHGECISVNINLEILPENKNLKSKYIFEKRRAYRPSMGDGRLYRYYGYESYTSISQKLLMYFIANMQKDETILACLPTGGGKSLSWQLPAIARSYQGVIIVVVPTIALAIDHERSSKKIYDSSFGAVSYPLAYYGDVSKDKKQCIFNEIDAGTLPILYISPEALQNKQFQKHVLSAAEKGKVSALIIDEAHLIVNWGVRFRPEFQLLAAFRNRLKEASTLGLKTILLSATYTQEDTEIIKNLFAEEIFTEYRADELRPEPAYYSYKCNCETERLDIIDKLVSQAPKPLIVYSVGPEEGVKVYNRLKEIGYKNLALFTGQTSNKERENIIDKWNKNKIDIMVATSAFGMGVDKADVRTVITAYIPETISRFYQEVGRAGRDGYACLNYLLTYDEIDKEYVKSLTKGTVLTVDSLVGRWKELLADSIRESPDVVWIDINIPPEHLKFEHVGKRNAGWNKDVVLFLYRSGLIGILDVQNINHGDYKILIKLKNIGVLENTNKLTEYISDFRTTERERIIDGINGIDELLKSENRKCYSSLFVNEFPYSVEICSGCPFCRKSKLDNFIRQGNIYINSTKAIMSEAYGMNTDDAFSTFLYSSNSIMLTVDKPAESDMVNKCIEFLVKKNVDIIIAPNIIKTKELLDVLSIYENYKYLILTLDEAEKIEPKWLNGVCGALYSDDDEYNQYLYGYLTQYTKSNADNRIIHIAQYDQFIKSEMRPLSELVDQNLLGEHFILGGICV